MDWDIPATCLLNEANQPVYLGLKEIPSGKLLYEVVMDSVRRILERERYRPDHALFLNGSTAVLNLPEINLPKSGWSAELWFRADTLPLAQVTLLADPHGNALVTMDADGMLKAGTNFLTTSGIQTGQWYLLSLVFDGNNLQSYLNGRLAQKVANYAGESIKFAKLGNNGIGNQPLKGYLGEFRLWREARTELEIHQNRFLTFKKPLPSTLVAAWVFDEKGSTAIVDKTGKYMATIRGGDINSHILSSIANTQLSGSFFHYVGPGQSKKYKLELYTYGDGTPLCSNLNYEAEGSTLGIQQLTLSAGDRGSTHEVRLEVKKPSTSALPESYQFSRFDGENFIVIGTISADSTVFYDRFAFDSPASLTNGVTYTYFVRAQSFRFPDEYSEALDTGGTVPINFKITVPVSPNRVGLTWNNLKTYADELSLTRDGQPLAKLAPSATTYIDEAPIPGKQHIYELTLFKNGLSLIGVKDTGGVVPNGHISGWVLTTSGDYGVPLTKIVLKASIAGLVSRDSVVTDSTGHFTFDSVYYGEQAVFTVEASKANYIFSPRSSIDATLSLAEPQQNGLLFRTTKIYKPIPDSLPALSQFKVAPILGENALNLTWAYQPDPKRKPTLFKIYRDKKFLAIIQDRTQFQDTLAQPGSKPKYELFAYTLWRDTIREDALQQQLLVPKLLAPEHFTATADTTLGKVNLQWTYTPSSSYSGFVIVRDNLEIARVSRDTRNYTDLGGVPGRNHSYQIEAFWHKFDTLYHSDTLEAACIYPKLPDLIFLAQKVENVFIELNWAQRADPDYNFDGWAVLRSKNLGAPFDTLGYVPKGAQLKFLDATGEPQQRYIYRVCAYAAIRLGRIRFSETIRFVPAQYPALAPPSLMASTNLVGKVELSWTAPTGQLFNGYLLYRNGTLLQRLSSNRLSYTDYQNAITQDISANYTLKTYDVRKGKEVQSAPSAVAVGTAIHEEQTTLPPAPADFSASREYPTQIQLSWTYPKYIIPHFELLRDGEKIATLEGNLRSYKDFGLIQGQEYEYSIRAVRSGKQSNWARTAGELNSLRTALGSVRYAASGKGISNALVSLQGTAGLHFVQSDANGVFRFENLSDSLGSEMTLLVRTPDQLYQQATKFKIEANKLTYVFDIEVQGGAVESMPEKIAQPHQLAYRVDYVNNQVQFSWALKPGKYDSCLIFRGPLPIGTIKKGAAMSFIDSTATPGLSFLYRVVARYQQDSASTDFVFVENPIILPVSALDAEPVPAFDEVFLSFNHQTNLVDYYQIERNNELIGVINPSQQLCFADTTGLPGRLYNYTVRAVKGSTASQAVSVRDVRFPVVDKVDSLMAIVSGNGIELNWKHRSVRCHGFNVYRDTVLIISLSDLKFQYIDYGGIPESAPLLGVSSFYQANDGKIYESDISYVQVKQSGVPSPLVSASPIAEQNAVKVSWEFSNTSLVDQIEVYRTELKLLPEKSLSENVSQFAVGKDETGRTIVGLKQSKTIQLKQWNGASYDPLGDPNLFLNASAIGNFANGPDSTLYVSLIENEGNKIYAWKKGQWKEVPGVPGKSTEGAKLAVDAEGTIYLAWFDPGNGAANLATRSATGAWSIYTTQQGNIRDLQLEVSSKGGVDLMYVQKQNSTQDKLVLYVLENGNFEDLDLDAALFISTAVSTTTNRGIIDIEGYFLAVLRPDGKLRLLDSGHDVSAGLSTQGSDHVRIAHSVQDEYYLSQRNNGKVQLYEFIKREKKWSLIFETQNKASSPEITFDENDLPVLAYIEENSGTIQLAAFDKGIKLYSGPAGFNGATLDNSGVPNQKYYYGAQASSKQNGKNYYSRFVIDQVDFPPVAPPTIVKTTSNLPEFIGISWSYPNTNVDSFQLERYSSGNGLQQSHVFDKVLRKFADNPGDGNAHNYKLLAVRVVGGKPYYSVPAEANNLIAADISGSIIASVTASDGTSKTQVLLEWTLTNSSAAGFAVYRAEGLSGDFKLLENLGPDKRIYRDAEADPGVFYVYYVAATNAAGETIDRKSDSGFRAGEGLINGTVLSKSNTPLAGVTIFAEGKVEGETIKYQTTTNSRGSFTLAGLFVGKQTTYTVYPQYLDHAFLPKIQTAELTKDIPNQSLSIFLDQDGFSLRGKASYALTQCPIPGLKILVKRYFETTANSAVDTITTEANGEFNRILDINEQFLTKVVLVPMNQRKEKIDSIIRIHEHAIDSVTWTKQELMLSGDAIFKEFLDHTAYQLVLKVVNACGDELGEDQFIVNVKSRDACFSKNYTTTVAGKLKLELPPLDYFVTVTGAKQLRSDNIPMVEYFKVRPIELRMDTAHAYREIKNKIRPDSIFTISMQYHTAPKVVVNGFSARCENKDIKVISSKSTIDLSIQVEENFGASSTCKIAVGSIRIVNPAAATNTDTRYDLSKIKNGVLKHSFIGGSPALVAPYIHTLYVEYYDESGSYLAGTVISIIVEGERALEGFDVIVDPLDKEGGSVMIPLYVLRDPPGDKSYSFVKKGTKVAYEIGATRSDGGGAGVEGEVETSLFGLGFKIQGEAKVGNTNKNSKSFVYSLENTEEYGTAEESIVGQDGEYVDGKDADVVVGMGLVQQFGINYNLTADKKSCAVTLTPGIGLTNISAKTTWNYTYNHIHDLLLPELRKFREEIGNGTRKLTGKSNTGTPKDTIFYGNLIRNWEKVLHYYEYETVPFCYLCEQGYLDQYDKPEWIKTKLKASVGNFCNKLRQKSATVSIPAEEKIAKEDEFCYKAKKTFWDSELIEAYNLASKDFELGLEYLSTTGLEGTVQSVLKNSAKVFSTLGPNQIENIFNQTFGAFGPEAKNITFGGNTKYETELTVARAKNLNFEFEHKFEGTLGITPFKTSTEVKMSTGISVGLGVATTLLLQTKVAEVKNYFTFNTYIDVTRTVEGSGSQETTQSLGYVLSDDDDGDQFSVSIIRGLAPNHTPYFQLLGGRSACPYEEGTIDREHSNMILQKPDGTPDERVKFNIPANKGADFSVSMSNINPFGETRSFKIHYERGTNPYGAIIKINGSEPDPNQLFYVLPTGSPDKKYANITIERNPFSQVYQYEDIKVCLVPECYAFGYNIPYEEEACVNLSAFFINPCTDISIVEPGNNWLINNGNTLQIKVTDYDLKNTLFKGLQFQYRRKGVQSSSINDNFGWTSIDNISVDSLKRDYERFRLQYPKPTYNYVWNTKDLPDGEYEIRMIANCAESGTIFSNVFSGKIARGKLNVFGKPEPADGILSFEDNIRVQFNKPLDQGRKAELKLVVVHVETGDTLEGISSQIAGNLLNITIPDAMLDILDNQHLKVLVDRVYDAEGNTLLQPVEWSFLVLRNPVYWYPMEYKLRLYKGQKTKIATHLFNSSQTNERFNVALLGMNSWLKPQFVNFPVNTQGFIDTFEIDTRQLQLDSIYRDTVFGNVLRINGAGFNKMPSVVFEVEIVAIPPAWDSLYKVQNFGPALPMLVETNWRFTTDALPSTDTLDLISIWRGNEIRGLAKIGKKGNYYSASIQVRAADDDLLGAPLEFRIWDANTDTEYTAFGDSTLKLRPGQIIGSATKPFIVRVDPATDRARYIPLNSAGWTWFSLNSKESDMSVNNILREIKPLSGDIISNRQVKAVYNGSAWIPVENLLQPNGAKLQMDSMNVSDGYMIYLRGSGKQVIRITGSSANPGTKSLLKGWNFIGYSTQNPTPISATRLNSIQNISPGDVILSNLSRLDNNSSSSATYDKAGWLPVNYLIKPNRAYLLNMKLNGLLRSATTDERQVYLANLEDWQWKPDALPEQMLTYVTIENLPEGTRDEWALGVFEGNEVRGLATQIEAPGINRWLIQVSGDRKTDKLDLRLRNRRTGQEYRIKENLDFFGEQLDYDWTNPLPLHVGSAIKRKPIIENKVSHSKETLKNIALEAYPNPFSEVLQMALKAPKGTYLLLLRNMDGKRVAIQKWESRNDNGKDNLNWPLANLPAGMYYLELLDKNEELVQRQKLVKTH